MYTKTQMWPHRVIRIRFQRTIRVRRHLFRVKVTFSFQKKILFLETDMEFLNIID